LVEISMSSVIPPGGDAHPLTGDQVSSCNFLNSWKAPSFLGSQGFWGHPLSMRLSIAWGPCLVCHSSDGGSSLTSVRADSA
jgi:hypothetical protein